MSATPDRADLQRAAYDAVEAWVTDDTSDEAMAALERALGESVGLSNPSLNDIAARLATPDRADLEWRCSTCANEHDETMPHDTDATPDQAGDPYNTIDPIDGGRNDR